MRMVLSVSLAALVVSGCAHHRGPTAGMHGGPTKIHPPTAVEPPPPPPPPPPPSPPPPPPPVVIGGGSSPIRHSTRRGVTHAAPIDRSTAAEPATAAPGALIACPILHRRASEAQCAAVSEQAAALEQGVGAFAAPSTMVVGQPQDMSFAVGKQADAADTASSVGGTIATTVQIRTPIGQFMTAKLTGGGFEIVSEGTPERDLGLSRSEIWTWHVTPREQGPHKLLLTVKVDAVDDDGKRTLINLSSRTVAVNVGVTAADKRRRQIDDVKNVIDETGSIWPSLQKWLGGLAAVLLALGLVIWRFKLLGKKPEEPEHKDKPKD